jgi:hypothetical protein
MLDSYIKKLENIIVPRKYNVNDVKNINTAFDSNREQKPKANVSLKDTNTSDDFAKTKKTHTQSDLQPIREESSRGGTIADEEKLSLIEIINIEKKKNMNYRFEIGELQRKVEYLNQKIEKQGDCINKLERQKDLDSKYLIKLEAMLSGREPGNVNSMGNTTRQFSNISKIDIGNDFKTNFNKLLLDENQKLKRFQEEVFKISRCYDEVNDELIYYLKEIQQLLSHTNEDDYRNEQVVGTTISSIKSKPRFNP